jgi:biofilm PGA synthesis N-glycosyltransferase PgaC
VAEIILFIVVLLSITNLIRMAIYLISSDAYLVKSAIVKAKKIRQHLPTVTIIIPAFNEERTILRALSSAVESNYPANKLTVIVANDGSTDKTREIAQLYKKMLPLGSPTLILQNRANQGKASAINYALRRHGSSRLTMCLDADSALRQDSLRSAVQYFRDRNIVACSSNVNIIDDGKLFALIQRFEYLVCYQMKRGQALLDIEYIVGGIGSIFRTSMLKRVGYYDSNTMTEDIDLTMKIIVQKRKSEKIVYAHDSIVDTEAAHSMRELMQQRYRWKFGRSQSFLKHRSLFFSREDSHRMRLSWFILPYAIVQDVFFLLEPLVVLWFLYVSIMFGNVSIFISAMTVVTIYLLLNIWSSSHISIKERLTLTYYAPAMYVMMYVLSYAEFYALIRSLIEVRTLSESIQSKHIRWKSPQRNATP